MTKEIEVVVQETVLKQISEFLNCEYLSIVNY